MNNIEKFVALLSASDAVSLDHGALLTNWDSTAITGHPESHVVQFSWTDGEHDYSEIFDEGGIADGCFDDDGRFVVENTEGEKTVIRFFEVSRLSQPQSGRKAAETFMQELLDSVETLSGIAYQHGTRTLADLMFLQQAILKGGFIDHYPNESAVLKIAEALPSGERWLKHIKIEFMTHPF